MRLSIRDGLRWVAVAGLWILPAAFGQGTKNPGTTTTPATTTGVTNTTNPSSIVTPNSNLPPGFQPTPQFVQGKVVMDDGTAVPADVPIERLCGGVAHIEGHTDDRGGFGFEMGHDDMLQDSSYNGRATLNPNQPVVSSDIGADPNRPYRECEIRANLPGYRSDSILLATYKPSENSNIGTMMLHRMSNVAGSVISANTAAAPRNAVKEYEKGLEEAKKGKTTDAIQSEGKAVALYPQFAAAWLELGKLQVSLKQEVDARRSFESAVKAEPKFISPYVELSQLAFQSRRWQDLVEVTDQLLKLDALDFPREYYYNGLANYTLQRMEPAEKSLRETVRLDTQNHFPKAHQFLAAVLVKKKDLPGAEAELRTYLKLAPAAADADNVRHQLDQLERVTGLNASAGK
jgi:tetratricopeptide (TPR) repeat protein